MNALTDHFAGRISFLRWEATDRNDTAILRRGPEDDLRAMATRALNYFTRTPRPHLGYACQFGVSLESCPPGCRGVDLVANGDTDVRMDSAFPALREASGSGDGADVQEGLHRRILSYVGEDGLSHTPYALVCSSDMPPDTEVTSLWTTGLTIRSLAERWRVCGDEKARALGHRMARALMGLASWDTGRAFFPGGLQVAGEWIGGFFGSQSYFYTSQVADLLHYSTTCADDEVTDFALCLARGVLAGFPERTGLPRFRSDGSFTDHTHLHTRVLWGAAMAGRVSGEHALVEWARRGYEFVRSRGTDFGWFPERVILPGEHASDDFEERVSVSETCCTGDMVQVAVELARAGYAGYWDHVERYVSNYLREVQFALTPEIEEWYRARHAALPAADVSSGLELLRSFDGGFLSDISVSQWASPTFGVLPMAGCCVPEGARAVATAWKNAVTGDGPVVSVNLHFSGERGEGVVKGLEHGIEATVRSGTTWRLRPPAWAPRPEVRCFRDGIEQRATWSGDYLHFPGVREGQGIAASWPVPEFSQLVGVGGKMGAEKPYTIEWRGNRVRRIVPPGRQFPLFARVQPR